MRFLSGSPGRTRSDLGNTEGVCVIGGGGGVQKRGSESESCPVVSDSLQPHGPYSPWNSPGLKTGVGSYSFLQGIFPTQGSNPGVPHCKWILSQLSHQGSLWGGVGGGCGLSPEPLPPRFELSLQTVLSPSRTPGLPRFFLIPLSPLTL